MALADANVVSQVPVPVRDAARAPTYLAALQRLPLLHAQAHDALRLNRLLARAPQACVTLMLAGAALLLLTGSELKPGFTWTIMLLLGITAMIRTHIRGLARSLRRVPLEEAAADLRLLLFYCGTAWGSGAFLIMPALPAPALALLFALLPSLSLALCLKADRGVAYFTLPVTTATAGAAWMGAWPLDRVVAPAILLAGIAIAILPALQQTKKSQPLPY